MWFSATPFEICFSTTMFYSIFFISKCRSDDIPRGVVLKNNKDGSLHIYVNNIPREKASSLNDDEKNHIALKAWLLATISVGVIACFCCICWKYYRKGLSRRRSSFFGVVPPRVAEIVPPASRTVLSLQIDHYLNTGVRRLSMETGNIYNSGVVNFAFSSTVRDPVPVASLELDDRPPVASLEMDDRPPVPPLELNDRPPEYSVVVSETGVASAVHPQVPKTKKVETPPPDYTTISPFDNYNRSNSAGELFV